MAAMTQEAPSYEDYMPAPPQEAPSQSFENYIEVPDSPPPNSVPGLSFDWDSAVPFDPVEDARVQEEKRVALEEKLIWLKSLPMVMPSDLEDFGPSEYDFLWLMNIIGGVSLISQTLFIQKSAFRVQPLDSESMLSESPKGPNSCGLVY